MVAKNKTLIGGMFVCLNGHGNINQLTAWANYVLCSSKELQERETSAVSGGL